jgi:catechol 2,3-dioxygenase-like lactoylglutathione lyase family enzyme
VLDHLGLETSDLTRSGRFYDAVFFPLGVRRVHEHEHAIAYGVTGPVFWLTARTAPAPGFGHLAFRASGRVAVDAAHAAGLRTGGTDVGAPGPRPQYGAGTYAAYLLDPDGVRIEIVTGHGG